MVPHPAFMLLSPLGERLGEGVMQEAIFALTPSPNLSPKGERNMKGMPALLAIVDLVDDPVDLVLALFLDGHRTHVATQRGLGHGFHCLEHLCAPQCQ